MPKNQRVLEMHFSQEEQYFYSLLEKEYTWPDFYKFRFICASSSKDNLLQKIDKISNTEKLVVNPSAQDHYFSITFRLYVVKSEEVVQIYRDLSIVPGVIKI